MTSTDYVQLAEDFFDEEIREIRNTDLSQLTEWLYDKDPNYRLLADNAASMAASSDDYAAVDNAAYDFESALHEIVDTALQMLS